MVNGSGGAISASWEAAALILIAEKVISINPKPLLLATVPTSSPKKTIFGKKVSPSWR
jgi:hypothetical protein